MFTKFIRSKTTITGLAITTFILIFLLIAKTTISPPKLISTDPPNNAKKHGVIKPLMIKVSSVDDLNDFQVSSIPDQKWELKVIDNQIISAHPSTPLLPNTNYTIKIIWKDKTIHQFVIRTEDTQTDYELLKKLDDELARDYPLARLVPYEESAYRVIYLEPLTLGITIQNPNLTSSEVIEEIKKWVKDNGGDPEKHSYKITPSATP